MADVKISALPAASTPLTGGEVLPIVQSSTTKQVAVSNLTAGLSGTASININGTVGATTATTGAFTSGTFSTTLGVTGATTLAAVNTTTITATGNISTKVVGTVTNLDIGDSTNANSSSRLTMSAGLNNKGWRFGVQDLVGAALTLTASTTNGGSTFTTPLFTITDAGAVTIPGTLGVTGVFSNTGWWAVDGNGVLQLGTPTIGNYFSIRQRAAANMPANAAAQAGVIVVDGTTASRFTFYDKDGNRNYVTGTPY